MTGTGRFLPFSGASRPCTSMLRCMRQEPVKFGHSLRASPQLIRAYGKTRTPFRLGGGGDSNRGSIKMHLPQASNFALGTVNNTHMTGKGWYAHIHNECCLFAHAVVDAACVCGLNGFVEIAADRKTRTKSLGFRLSTNFGINAAAE